MPIRDRYPGADILAQRGHWDDATRKVVLDRVYNTPPYRFFNAHQQRTLNALCDRVIPQAHHPPDRRVPIAPRIDESCLHKTEPGYRFEDMPPNDQAWEWGLAGLDEAANELFGKDFADLGPAAQDEVCNGIREGAPPGRIWGHLPAKRWWRQTALRQIAGVYYAHPYAWDEIGYGGPAYPRGYYALNHGMPEAWEPREVPTEIPGPGEKKP